MISIITPTFNRAHTLPRLITSLRAQSLTDFEWIVVDDGSSDNTQSVIADVADTSTFTVCYFYQENGGKPSAVNRGILEAKGEYLFVLDSDDYLVDDAMILIHNALEVYKNTAALCFRKQYSDGRIVGNVFNDEDPISMRPIEAAEYFGGDLLYLFKTNAICSFLSPNIMKEKFVPEIFQYNTFSDFYQIQYIPNVSLQVVEYLEDGYSKNFMKNLQANPMGFLICYTDLFCRSTSLKQMVKNVVRMIQCIGFYRKKLRVQRNRK